MSREMTGAEMVVEALKDQGADTLFGYPGGAVLPIYDAIFHQNYVKHVLVRHEQGAAHAAEGYARSTGRVGVLLVTSGPGATNTVTGLTDALMDSIPLVCITGQVPTHLIGSDAFQECDTVGITRHCTKHNYLVRNIAEWRATAHLAMPENIVPIFLPSRSPELNPQENIWRFIRHNWLSNRVVETYEAIVEAACDAWNRLTAMPKEIKSIGLRQWAHRGHTS